MMGADHATREDTLLHQVQAVGARHLEDIGGFLRTDLLVRRNYVDRVALRRQLGVRVFNVMHDILVAKRAPRGRAGSGGAKPLNP